MSLYDLTVAVGEDAFSLRAHACAVHYTPADGRYNLPASTTLYVLSAVGPGTAVKGCAAALNRANRELTKLTFHSMPKGELAWWEGRPISGHFCGFRTNYTRLAMDTWQMLALARDRSLLTSDDDESLWQYLKSDRFTTPLLRPWLPEVVKQLRAKQWIRGLHAFGCRPCLAHVHQDRLDEMVSTLVAAKALTIEE